MDMKQHEIPQGLFPTACGAIVEVGERSKLHLEAHPEVASILVEAIEKARICSVAFAEIEVDMGRIVGQGSLVPTDALMTDSVTTFALRNGRDFPSRVAVVPKGPECSAVSLVVNRWACTSP